jgi:hypothetical protein
MMSSRHSLRAAVQHGVGDRETNTQPELDKVSFMSTQFTVPQSEWRRFFDRMSTGLLGKWAEIEMASLELGDQIIAEWIPLLGITYDAQDDLLDIALDRANHVIRHPREILAEETVTGLISVAILDENGATQVVRLKQPLMLPLATSPVNA